MSVVCLGMSTVVSAQVGDADAGRAAFARGMSAREAGDLPVARDALAESYALDPNAVNAYQLAKVLHEIGRDRDAIEIADVILGGSLTPVLSDSAMREVRALRLEADRRLGTLRIHNGGATRPLRVDANDEGMLRADGLRIVRLDAGEHIVRLGNSQQSVRIGRGSTEELRFHATPAQAEADPPRFAPAEAAALVSPAANEGIEGANIDDHRVRRRRRILGVFGALAIVGVTVTLIVVLRRDEDQALHDDVFGRTDALIRF